MGSTTVIHRLEDRARRLTQLLEISKKINREKDLSDLLDLLLTEATTILDADRASIFLLDKKKEKLESRIAQGQPEPLIFDAKAGIAGKVLSEGQVLNIRDAYNDPVFNIEIDKKTGYRTQTMLCAPMKNIYGRSIGVIQVLNKRSGPFGTDDEELIVLFASHAAIAIENCRAFKDLKESSERLHRANDTLKLELRTAYGPDSFIGSHPKVKDVLGLVEKIRDEPIDLLITGESGTGKELVSRIVHFQSPRAPYPFVAINCAAIPDNLLEAELFGIEKGVATGVDRRVGKIEQADGGTLFLDEIADMPPATQAKILRVLQDREVVRVGTTSGTRVDVRIIAATNKDLKTEIAAGRFREDLYYRLNVVSLHLPSLRERPEDIPVLAEHYVAVGRQKFHKTIAGIAPEAMQLLTAYDWPGNVREMENEIYRLVVLTENGQTIQADSLSEAIRTGLKSAAVAAAVSGPLRSSLEALRAFRADAGLGSLAPLISHVLPEILEALAHNQAAVAGNGRGSDGAPPQDLKLKRAVEDLEQRYIREALTRSHGHLGRAARLLGISRKGLANKFQRYGIDYSRQDFKE